MSDDRIDDLDGGDVAALSGLYALDALEGDELARFEAYLQTHPEAQDEVDGFRSTAARLASTRSAPAPAQLRANVLGSLSDVRQDPPQLDVARARRRRATLQRVAGVAAAIVLVVAAGVGGFALGADDGAGTDETAEGISSILAESDASLTALAGDGDLSATLVYSASSGRAVVVAQELPGPPDGQTYELWQVRDGEAVSAGLFVPDDGVVRTGVDADLASGDTVAVTIEPEGGSATPTMPIVMSATI